MEMLDEFILSYGRQRVGVQSRARTLVMKTC